MNNEIRYFLTNHNLVVKRITIKGKVIIIDIGKKKFVVKKRSNDMDNLFKYLTSRSFVYFPKIIYRSINYDFYEYINSIDIPKEQKAMDIIKLTSNLHNKTTYYMEVDENYYKKIYEDILNNIDYLGNYYNDIAEIIEKEEFMSPSEYLFIRNISRIFMALNYAKFSINEWFKIIDEKKRVRMVNIHNNLSLEHYLIDDKPYFISWEKSKKDLPIYDLLKFYKRYFIELDFCDLFKNYELVYPWQIEEKRLFFCMISLPDKIDFNDSEYKLCEKIRKFYTYLNSSQRFINDYFPEKKKEHT